MLRILPVPLGTANTYRQRGTRIHLIDAGFPRQGKILYGPLETGYGLPASRLS